MSDQYRTIAERAGYADCTGNGHRSGNVAPTARGRLRVDGADAASFLQALVSNDVTALHPGEGAYATYLTPQGRMLADLEIYLLPNGIVCSVAAELAAPLTARLDQLIFSEDVRVTDISAEIGELVVVGSLAAEVLGEALAIAPETLTALPELGHVGLARGFVSRAWVAALPSYRVFMPVRDLAASMVLLDRMGLPALSDARLDALRIEHGRPAWGADLTTETIPLEAGLLERAISTSKGCYVGQEIVIRILHRGGGRVARRLVKLTFDEASAGEPAAGDVLATGEGTEAGRLTSVSRSPTTDRWIALGYLGRDYAEVGRRVTVRGTALTATVAGMAG